MPFPRKTNRREFLQGRSAARAVADLLPEEGGNLAADPITAASRGAGTYLLQVGRPAMGCEFQVYLNAGEHPGATESALEALDLVERLEDQMTVYRDHSELNQINRMAADEPIAVEAGLFGLLREAVALNKATEGAFDITASPLWKVWGFHRHAGRFPEPGDLETALRCVGSEQLQLDDSTSRIRFARHGVELNLGAIGKGYALDRCGDLLLDHGVTDFVIHGGLSSILAHGSRLDGKATSSGWSLGLRHPLHYEQRLAEIWLRDQALGTSGSGNQFFHFDGKRYGHVIDPRTGYPAGDLLSATVLAPTAARADALATAFFVMGLEESLEFCASRPELAVLLVRPGSRSGSIEIHPHGLDDDQWRRL